jgi:hypothetical protein
VRRRQAGAAAFGPTEEVLRRAFGTYPYDATASVGVGPDGRVWLPYWIDGGAPGEPSGAILAAPPAEGFRTLCPTDAELVAAGGAGHVALGGLDSYGQDQLGFSFRRFTGSDPCASFTSTGLYTQASPLVPVLPLALRVDARGGTHAVWAEGQQTVTLRAGYIDPAAESGRPSPPTGHLTLTTTARELGDVAADEAGETLVSWLDTNGPQAALLDHEPPRITAMNTAATYVRGTPFAASGTAADRHGIASMRWAVLPAFPLNAPPIVEFTGPRPTLPALAVPERTATVRLLLTVRDSAGYETTAERRISIRSATAATPVKPAKPVLDLSTKRFAARASGAPIDQGSSIKRGGSRLQVVGTSRSQATFTLTRLVEGRLDGSRCRTTARTGPRCSAERDLGSPVVLALAPGDNMLRLTGRWGTRTLSPGLYRLQVVLRVTANGGASAPSTITFRIRRPAAR